MLSHPNSRLQQSSNRAGLPLSNWNNNNNNSLSSPSLFDRSLFSPSRWLADMDSMMGSMMGSMGREFAPAVDVRELSDKYIFHVEVPGCRPEDLQVDLKNGALVISGKKEEQKRDEGSNSIHEERRWGSFSRSFQMAPDTTPQDIIASFNNGVLEVAVAKKGEALEPRQRIEINRQSGTQQHA